MRISEKIARRAKDNWNEPGVTIAFLGDSVTQGCFGSTLTGDYSPFFDKDHAYHADLAHLFAVLYPGVPVNIIPAGVSGGNAQHGLERLEREVLSHNPDLTVVCFGLNDSGGGEEKLPVYLEALEGIFTKLKAADCEIIFMTPNMMCTDVSPLLLDDHLKKVAEGCAKRELDGGMALYLDAAKDLCAKHGVTVCDCYARWRRLYETGANITELLSNKINHPTREMNWLFAISLAETMLGM